MLAPQMLKCRYCSSLSDVEYSSGSRIIINADDFGFSADIDSAIIRFAESGAISSASLMAVGSDFNQAASWAVSHQNEFSVGVHLCISDGVQSLTSAQGLVNSNGCFQPLRHLAVRAINGTLPLDAIRKEWTTQIARVRSCGIQPTHLNSHQHVHILPGIAELVVEIAAAEKLAVRHTNGPFGFSFLKCAGCIDYWGTYCRPGVWKSAVVRYLGASLKQRLILAGVTTIDSYLSPSSLCGHLRGGASSEAVIALVRLSSGLGTMVEWVVHPSDAARNEYEPVWMSRMRAWDNHMLGSRLHLKLLDGANMTLASYADVVPKHK